MLLHWNPWTRAQTKLVAQKCVRLQNCRCHELLLVLGAPQAAPLVGSETECMRFKLRCPRVEARRSISQTKMPVSIGGLRWRRAS